MKTPLRSEGIAMPCPGELCPLLHQGLLVLLILLLSAFLPAAAQSTLSTDLPDYPPGATVTLTGSGFAAGEDVTLRVLHQGADSLGTDPQYHESWTVTADSAGGFVTYWVVPLDGDAAWATLIASADGFQSGLHAEAIFTDAPPKPNCNLAFSVSTSVRCADVLQTTFTATYSTGVTGLTWSVTGTNRGNTITPFDNNNSALITWSPTASVPDTVTFSVSGASCNGQSSLTQRVQINPLAAAKTAAAGSGATSSAITANWSASANATKYLLDLSTDASFGTFVTAGGKTFNGFDAGSVTTYTISGLTANTTYYYRVRAANSCGAATVSNSITYATLPTAPAAPVAAAGSATACSSFTASWSAATGATGYFLDVATNNNFNTNFIVSGYNNFSVGAATSVSVTGLTAGTTYYYRVRAGNSGGLSGYSNTIAYATSPAAPLQPGSISGNATPCSGASGVAYSVAAVTNASSYSWTLPAGATIAAGDGGNSITVNFGSSGGSISVYASNSCGSGSPITLPITLNVAPALSSQPAVQSITYGSNATFTVGASGTPTPAYQWQEYISAWNNLSNGGGYSGTVTASLRINVPGVAASGRKYRCIVTNSCGNATTDETAVLTVAPRPITLTADPASKTYGDGDPAFSAQVTLGSIVGTDTHTGTLGRAPGEGAGTYGITKGTYSYGPNYAETFISALLTINPRPITLTADPKTKTYGDPDPALTAQVTAGSIVGTDAAGGTLSRAPGENVGRYFIGKGSYTYGSNYLETYVGDSLAIGRRAITLTADAAGKIYGDNDPMLTARVTSGNIVGTDAFTGTLTRAAGEDTGHYAIGKGSYTYGNNYSEAFTGALFAISQRAITIKADATGKIYGNSDPALTAQVTSGTIVGTDAAGGSLQRASGESAGTYAISQGTYSYGSNYQETFIGNDFTIGQRPITLTADAQGKTYGDPDPALTAQVTSGSIVGTDAASGSLSRAPGENVGRYAIGQGTYTYGSNYLEIYVRDSLTIGRRSITITADPKSKTYGDADPALTAQVTSGTIVGTDAASGALQRAPGENVGRYAIGKGTYSYGSNYSETFVRDSLSIGKRPITISANATGKTYGNADPLLTAQVTSGSIVGTDAASGALTRASGEDVGTYALSQGTYSYGSNYQETFVSASFSIGQRPLTLNVTTGQHKTYGNADPASFAYTLGAAQSLASWDAFSGALSRDAGETIGGYPIRQSGLLIKQAGTDHTANYAITFNSALFTIDKRPIGITADAKSKSYGSADPALTFAITSGSLAFSNAFSGSLTRAPGEDVGTYAIAQGTVSLDSNYTFSYTGALLTINPASISTYVGVPGPGRRQYSDTLSFRVRIAGGAPKVAGAPGAASSVTFRVGAQAMGTVPLTTDGADLVALLPPKKLVEGLNGQMAPGNKTISAVLNSPSANYGLTSVNNTLSDAGFSIDKEDARTEYTGDQIMGTANATAVNATVKLRATIYDITAMTADAAYDTAAGDICKAKVKFVNRDNGTDISGWLPVTLVATDGKIGTTSFDYAVTLGSTETDREITVGIVVDNGYYIRNSPADNTVITVYKPVGDFITGGGHVVPDKSVGTYRSDSASRTNFGFNVKYNKKGANLQGNMNIIFRRTESDGLHTYQIKANSLQSLGVNASNTGRQTAQFSSKANLTDVTNPLAPIAKGGNKMLYVNMTDRGDPGTQDSISIVLVEGSADPGVLANLLYSSEWVASRNGQKGLRGGNLLVKSGFSVSTTGTTVRTMATGEATASEGASPAARFGLQAYPNSTAGQFRLLAESDDTRTPLLLRIFDISGRLVQQFTGLAAGSTVEAGSGYAHGSYIAELTQGSRRVTVKLIKE